MAYPNKIILYGHRGARGEAPENTVAGFEYARRLGINAFELDVRLTADGRLAVIHDAKVDRTTDAIGEVATFSAAQLALLDARGRFRDWPMPCGVPILDDVLASIGLDERLEIEIKTDSPARLEQVCDRLVASAERYKLAGRATFSSFDPTALDILSHRAPEWPRGYIGAFDGPQWLETALTHGCTQVDVPVTSGSKQIVRAAHTCGLRVTGWPGNTAEQLTTLVDWGVDGITTDYPSLALPFLRERGLLEGDVPAL